jgi:hypothetical protein
LKQGREQLALSRGVLSDEHLGHTPEVA